MLAQSVNLQTAPALSVREIMKKYILLFCFLLTGCVGYNWDGAFPEAKITYIFVDGGGEPIEGVMLVVLNAEGNEAFNFPINKFVPETSIISNSQGVMEFAHISKRALEFGGSCTNLYVTKVGVCSTPVYTLKFMWNKKEVYSIPYNDLAYLGEEITIKQAIYTSQHL
jgi:hypothetical protein